MAARTPAAISKPRLVFIAISVGKDDLGIIIPPLPILTQANRDFSSRLVAEKVSMAVKSNADFSRNGSRTTILMCHASGAHVASASKQRSQT